MLQLMQGTEEQNDNYPGSLGYGRKWSKLEYIPNPYSFGEVN